MQAHPSTRAHLVLNNREARHGIIALIEAIVESRLAQTTGVADTEHFGMDPDPEWNLNLWDPDPDPCFGEMDTKHT